MGSDNAGFGTSKALEATLPTTVGGATLTTGSINVLQLYTTGNTAANTLTLFGAASASARPRPRSPARPNADGKIQIVAAQFTGQTPAAIQAQAETIAKQADSKVVLANTTIGGKPVTTATYPRP